MCELRTVQWEDVSESTDFLFHVWSGSRELEWAKKSWQGLSKHGLTSYRDQVERSSVIIRLIALADIYRGFCHLAFDEVYEPEYTVWASELNLKAFRVAQCVGPQFERDEEADADTLFDQALSELIRGAIPPIYEALKTEFGDDSLLFVSLWNSVDYERDRDDGESEEQRSARADVDGKIDCTEDAYWILNTEPTAEKQQAFNWVCQGFCS
jgi:hypothetical protein